MSRHPNSEILPRNTVRLSSGAFRSEPTSEEAPEQRPDKEEFAALIRELLSVEAPCEIDENGVMHIPGSGEPSGDVELKPIPIHYGID